MALSRQLSGSTGVGRPSFAGEELKEDVEHHPRRPEITPEKQLVGSGRETFQKRLQRLRDAVHDLELCPEPPASPGSGRVLLEHPVALDPRSRWLMRCDRVDFEPGGVALPHRHRGGGIRWLLRGALDVTVGESPARRMAPGSAWFSSLTDLIAPLGVRRL